jgi:plastocyanin
MRAKAVLLAIVVAALLVGCGGGSSYSGGSTAAGSGAGGGGSAKSVKIVDYTYEPASLTVPVGTTVSFTNRDSTAHTATSKESGAFESGSIEPGKSAEITLDKAGTYAYFCAFHPFMKGTIEVE